MKTAVLSAALAVALGGTAFAGDTLDATSDTAPTGPVLLADAEMEGIVAGNHVIRLVQFRTGKDALPTAAANDATTRAGSVFADTGNDRPSVTKFLP